MAEKLEVINYWLKSAEHDLDSANSIFISGRYDWCLFVAHLALEKILKAVWIKNNDELIPPRTHNLVKLAEGAKLSLSDEEKLFLYEVSDFNVEARYPDKKFDFYQKCTRGFTEKYLNRIKGFYDCIHNLI